jgi:TetR/AcrR family transcriptional repressor of nem operon
MGRKLEFNYGRAVEQATRVFWRKGYRAASMRDLLNAMGIGEGSFYHLFESKERLYLECLKHYNATVNRRRLDALENEPSVRKGIRSFFRDLLDDLDDGKTPHVCLMARSLSAEVMGERKLRPYVKSQMTSLQMSFSDRLEAAKKAGELPAGFSSEMSAKIIFTYLQGYFRVVKVLKSGKQMREEIEALLKSLGL